ncbi:MAG: Omp28-related outer membrane protein [Bacteroidota bacterium]|nr:Omp28-related outer membrane protein [Bacteroidota bacterium]MDP4233839.1 Omp28-related outer membrane protein [Bacteroidota bacterium]MDP4242462.1 Omp28-related outer membrane protein [Bacteroidota bacterium]MDP4289050.1 Omp28-related outer membrane protein [Bacteroidota bacterium]
MKKLFGYWLVVLSATILLLTVTRAQGQLVPRTVLLEEGTNWSCGPCAQVNPFLEAFLQSHGDSIIQIAYHPNWPGANDPMYMNDETDNQGRVVSYYGISGVPTVEMDGNVVTNAPVNYEQAFYARIAKLSPVALSMTRNVVDGQVNISVTINPVGNVSTYSKLKLRVAPIEQYVDTSGPNGEKRFMNPMRAMMPNLNGTPLTLKTGEPQTFTFSYPLKSSYRAEKMYEVAFVQNDDAQREVLQATSTLESFGIVAAAGQHPVQIMQGSNSNVGLLIQNTTPEDLTFDVHYVASAGADWQVTATGVNGTLSIPVQSGASGDITLAVTEGSSPYTAGSVIARAISGRGDTLVRSFRVKFISSTTKVAFVDMSGDSASSVGPLKTLTAMRLRYVPLTDIEAASFNAWTAADFSTIVTETNKWIVTGSNKAAISAYLQSGGKLLIHGGEIAYGLADPGSTATDRDPAFLSNTLHATYVQDVASTLTVHGVTDDVVSNTFASQNVNINAISVDAQNQPDVITAANGGVPIFYYGSGTTQTAGIRWDDGNAKLVYLAFGLQNLATTTRQAITVAALNWFGVQAGVTNTQTTGLTIGNCYPNPLSASALIPYSLTRPEAVRISILDAQGAEVLMLVDAFESVGDHIASFDASHLARGSYFCVIHTAEGSALRPLTIE